VLLTQESEHYSCWAWELTVLSYLNSIVMEAAIIIVHAVVLESGHLL
jgi:hypothetical protein